MSDIEKIHGITPDLTKENVDKLLALFPEVATEITNPQTGATERAVDFDALKERLGDVAEGNRERYQFTWPGKREAKRLAREPIAKTLRPVKERSKNWDTTKNLYIEGDNLDALKILRENYAGKVKLIYIDPPYNTDGDLIYMDSYKQTEEEDRVVSGAYNDAGSQLVQNKESNGRFHSAWCEMIYPRLLLARDFLTADGAIFISIDENEADSLKKIADEIFGHDNFIAQIVWAGGRKNDSKYISLSHEYILCYAKSVQYLKENKIIWRERKNGLKEIYDEYNSLSAKYGDKYDRIEKEMKSWYKKLDDSDPAKRQSHYSSADKNGLYYADNISWPGGGGPRYEVLHPITKKPVTVPSRGWLFSTPERMKEVIAEGLVEFGQDETKVPCFKRYLSKTEFEVPYSVIYKDGRAASKRLKDLLGEKVFDNPKDEEIIARILSWVGTEKDSIIMDFFSGSGTTAHATFLQNMIDGGNRRFILVQIQEDLDDSLKRVTKKSAQAVIKNAINLCDQIHCDHSICTIAEERIRRAGEKIKSEIETENAQLTLDGTPKKMPDIGFRVLRVDDSNYEDRRKNVGSYSQADLDFDVDIRKSDRSDLDLLFEALPKFQLPYDVRVNTSSGGEFDGHTVYSVDDGRLLACFEADIPESLIRAMAAFSPRPSYALVSERSLPDSAARTNFVEIFEQSADSKTGSTKPYII
ncbi:site-specific DNA-methyltransferase [Bifidobacterium adolescentis]|uniref:site-specific DNA-methyltransferase n=2 Tax=Bifidobacterium adolescentis TaxID=1680 RepID=UPI00398D31D4